MGHEVEEVEIPYPSEVGTRVELLAIPPSQELVVVRSSAGPSSGFGATTDLVWPYPGDPRKVQFILQDEEEVQLWDVLGGRGLAMESDLAQTRARLEEALERVKSVHQVVTVDLPRVAEVSFLRSSLTPWSSIGYLNVFAFCFVGLRGDVKTQVSLPLRGACPGGSDVAMGRQTRARARIRPP